MIAGAAAKAAEETDPMEESYASAEYKRHVATIYARKAIEAAVARAAKIAIQELILCSEDSEIWQTRNRTNQDQE